MRKWDIKYFEENNKKLKIYLDSTENAIIVIDANDRRAVNELADMLKIVYDFELLNYHECSENIIWTLENYQNRKMPERLCLFDIQGKSGNYDVIKTLNVARELLRRSGFVVIILPSCLVDRIRIETPDLASYIRVFLNYNMSYSDCMNFWHSEESQYRMTKKEREDRKKWLRNNKVDHDNMIARYYSKIDLYSYYPMTEKDAYNMLDDLLFNMREQGDELLPFSLYKNTAELFVKHGYLDQAEQLYDEMISLADKNQKPLYLAEGLQGKAYCLYCGGEYGQSRETLDCLLALDDPILTDLWKYKLYSDYAICVYYTEGFDQAFSLWRRCRDGLAKINELQFHRNFRLTYNMVLAMTKSGKSIRMLTEEWEKLKQEIPGKSENENIEFWYYSLLDSWICMQRGLLGRADCQMERAYAQGLELFPENDEQLIIANYIRAVISLQMDNQERAQYFWQRGKNILNNQEKLKPRYDTYFDKVIT